MYFYLLSILFLFVFMWGSTVNGGYFTSVPWSALFLMATPKLRSTPKQGEAGRSEGTKPLLEETALCFPEYCFWKVLRQLPQITRKYYLIGFQSLFACLLGLYAFTAYSYLHRFFKCMAGMYPAYFCSSICHTQYLCHCWSHFDRTCRNYASRQCKWHTGFVSDRPRWVLLYLKGGTCLLLPARIKKSHFKMRFLIRSTAYLVG